MRSVVWMVMLCGLTLGTGAWAADAEPDLPVDAASVASGVPDSDQPAADPEAEARRSREISAALEQFENSIATLEGEQGPYDPSLIEVLLDFARYQSELGQHAAAADLFERAEKLYHAPTLLLGLARHRPCPQPCSRPSRSSS